MSDGFGSGFGKFLPGFDFLQQLAGRPGTAAAPGMAQLPHLSQWIAPTFNLQDLEKRIGELKAVHFWLEQNSRALAATIQALEVQKMTLAALQSMNFNLTQTVAAPPFQGVGGTAAAASSADDTSFAGLEIPLRTYGAAPADAPSPSAPASESAPASAPAAGAVDPMQWWGALSQQFQHIAAAAMQDLARAPAPEEGRAPQAGPTDAAPTAPTAPTSAPAAAASTKKTSAKTTPAQKEAAPATPVRSRSSPPR